MDLKGYIYVYHATPKENIDSIKKNGFNKDIIWVTDQFEKTFQWLEILSREKGCESWGILQVAADEDHVLRHYSSIYPTQYKLYCKGDYEVEGVLEEYDNMDELYERARIYEEETGIEVAISGD